jgi:hypothetical protein
MAQLLHELRLLDDGDWIHFFIVLATLIIGIIILLVILFWGLQRLKISLGKDGVKLNENANEKLDTIIEKMGKLEGDVVALQIMNEHVTPCERLKLYDYYKLELHRNSFIDEYIKVLKEEIDTSRFG